MGVDAQRMKGSPCLDCEKNGRDSSRSCGFTIGVLPPCELLYEFVRVKNQQRKEMRDKNDNKR